MLWTLLGWLLSFVVAGFVIWLVSKLNLGLKVTGFGAAFISAIAIALISGVLVWLVSLLPGDLETNPILGPIIWLVVAAVVLLLAGKFVPGLTVNGFVGALIAAVAIAIINWLVGLVLPKDAVTALHDVTRVALAQFVFPFI